MSSERKNERAGERSAGRAQWVFYALWAAILAASVHDGMLVVIHRSTILDYERNPLGRLLLHVTAGDVWLLLAVKAAGTILAGAVLLLVFWVRPRIGWAACVCLTLFQCGLMLFLTFN